MRTSEEILKEYIAFDDINGDNTIEMLPLTIVDAMEEYAEQKNLLNKHQLKRIKQAIIEAQKKYEYCIVDGNDCHILSDLINDAFKDEFKIDLSRK